MPTLKKRINIIIPKEPLAMLKALAQRDEVPIATKAKELLEEILEIYEDEIWAELAAKRDTKNAKYVSHEKAWS